MKNDEVEKYFTAKKTNDKIQTNSKSQSPMQIKINRVFSIQKIKARIKKI